MDFNLSGSINSTSSDSLKWVSLTYKKWEEWNPEVMVVNFLPYFHSDNSSTKEDHMALVQILQNLKSQMLQAQNITITVNIMMYGIHSILFVYRCAFIIFIITF